MSRELPYHEGGAELDHMMAVHAGELPTPDTGWPVGRQADIAAWFAESEYCAGCEERHERQYMHQCQYCDEYTCEGCHRDGERHGTRSCSHCAASTTRFPDD